MISSFSHFTTGPVYQGFVAAANGCFVYKLQMHHIELNFDRPAVMHIAWISKSGIGEITQFFKEKRFLCDFVVIALPDPYQAISFECFISLYLYGSRNRFVFPIGWNYNNSPGFIINKPVKRAFRFCFNYFTSSQ